MTIGFPLELHLKNTRTRKNTAQDSLFVALKECLLDGVLVKLSAEVFELQGGGHEKIVTLVFSGLALAAVAFGQAPERFIHAGLLERSDAPGKTWGTHCNFEK